MIETFNVKFGYVGMSIVDNWYLGNVHTPLSSKYTTSLRKNYRDQRMLL
jgi:hypothetical protein